MYKLLLLTLLTTLLSATNPKPYAVLGDIIYNDLEAVSSLVEIEAFQSYTKDINTYIKDVDKAKKIGFELEKGSSKVNKKEYLNRLRALSKSYDAFKRAAKANYKSSMKMNNYELFSNMINNSLIDSKKNKDEIMSYYQKNSQFIDANSGLIYTYLEEEADRKKKHDANRKKYKSKKMLEEEKIQRIRKNDKLEKSKREEELQEELLKKKLEIREIQKRELAN